MAVGHRLSDLRTDLDEIEAFHQIAANERDRSQGLTLRCFDYGSSRFQCYELRCPIWSTS